MVIASETSFHADLVESATEVGKPVVLQKPLCLTLEEADRMVKAVESSSTPFTVAWQMRADPENLKVKELLDGGELGKVFMVRRRHTLGFCLQADQLGSWHLDPAFNRDIWADDACHPIDFIRWILGDPVSVTAELGTLLRPSVPNDNGIAIFRYENGPMAEVCCSFVCLAAENTLEITAEKGVVIQNFGDGTSCPLRPAGAPGLKWRFAADQEWRRGDFPQFRSQGERIAHLASPLAEFLQVRRPPLATARDARQSLRLLLACYASSEQGTRLPFSPARIEAPSP